MARNVFGAVAMTICAFASACAGTPPAIQNNPDGLDPNGLPANVRSDYGLFAERCSKCHSLSRPLKSGIRKDEDWGMIVDRMRRQPGSGISPDDAQRILRFLHYFSQESTSP